MGRTAKLLVLLALSLGAPTLAKAQRRDAPAPPVFAGDALRTVQVFDLQGLDPQTVRARFIDAAGGGEPVRAQMTLTTPDGLVELVTLAEVGDARGSACAIASGDDPLPSRRLHYALAHKQAAFFPAQGLLVFRAGRLIGAYARPPSERFTYDASQSTETNAARLMRQPAEGPALDRPQDLPLESGAAVYLAHLMAWLRPLSALDVTCVSPASLRVLQAQAQAEPPPPFDTAGFFQGAGAAPLLLLQPHLNKRRHEMQVRGEAILGGLKLGEPLPGGADGFAATTPHTRLFRSRTIDYAVITLNLGGPPGGALSENAVGMIGVRNGRVEWISRSQGFDTGLCLDARGVRAAVRPGCSTTGYYSP